MTIAFAEIRQIIADRLREYLSVEQNRRDAQSALASFVSFFVFLFLASYGMMPSYLLIDRPGRAITVKFTAVPDLAIAELAQTRIQQARAATRTMPTPPAKAARPQRLESLSSMAASRPDYFGKRTLLPPIHKDRPSVSDAPERWQDRPAPQHEMPDRPVYGAASVAMPSPQFGTPTGTGDPSSEISFDVPVTGAAKGSDFITLSGRTRPSSVGQPGGKEMSGRRAILRKPMPTVPEWFERKGLDSFVALRIVISASGKVETAEVEKTSGFKEIDAEAREYVLQWLFEATGFRESKTIKLNYRLR